MIQPYTHLSGEELNREYDNRAQRPGAEFMAFVEHCKRRSADARSEVPCTLDIPFGPHAAERLDVFAPGSVSGAPVNIFFHGGYWRASEKEEFSYVAFSGRPSGVVTVVVNYALIPRVAMAELIEQCRRAVVWTVKNIRRYGGSPTDIYVSGHSAGAHIVSMLMCTDWRLVDRNVGEDLIKGACAISGVFDLEPVRRTHLNDVLNFTDSDVKRFSTIAITPIARCPLLCAVGAGESNEFIRQTQSLASRWKTHGMDIETHIVPGKDHFSIREDLESADAPMATLMLEHLHRAIYHSRRTE